MVADFGFFVSYTYCMLTKQAPRYGPATRKMLLAKTETAYSANFKKSLSLKVESGISARSICSEWDACTLH